MNAKLYLIPVPISEAAAESQLPAQVSEIIKSLKYLLVENVRTARRYISSLKLGIVIDDIHFEVIDKKTSEADIPGLLKALKQGNDVGVMSESGCPGVADPGSLAVAYAHELGVEVLPLVGPSSILLALMGSGMNGQKFAFHGYLPIDERERQKAVKILEDESAANNQTQIFIETPFRNDKLFNTLVHSCRKETRICIARDVLGSRQLIKTQSAGEWKKQKPNLNKIPVVFLIHS